VVEGIEARLLKSAWVSDRLCPVCVSGCALLRAYGFLSALISRCVRVSNPTRNAHPGGGGRSLSGRPRGQGRGGTTPWLATGDVTAE